MKIREAIYRLVHMHGVSHTTLNPYGPGVVRIHMIPPKFDIRRHTPSIIILNGMDIIPINLSWSILLNVFITEVNRYDGKEITDDDLERIVNRTLVKVRRVYPKIKNNRLKDDLNRIVESLCAIAYGKEVNEDIGYMSIGDYAPFMTAPHRIDLMVSAMTKNGAWHCNQKCLHCYAAGQPQAEVKELSTSEWKQIIDKCRKVGIPQVTFTGGEPTMRNDLVELVEHAQWFVTRVNTNGVNLTKELCKALYDASLDSIQITLYSSVEEEHNALVGANNFQKTVQGIKNALEAGLNVSINTPICKGNADYVKTLTFLHELGIEYVSCSGLIVTGNACREASKCTQLTEDELFDILKKATEYCTKEHMEISFTSPGWVSEEKLVTLNLTVPTCGACLSNMAISPDGSVVPCQSWLSKDAVLGNMLQDNWKKIWNAEACKKIRAFSSSMKQICPLRNKEEQ